MTQQKFTHTVHCFDDKSKRWHFISHQEAIEYANQLLAEGHQVKIYPYRPPRHYVDYLAERGPDGSIK